MTREEVRQWAEEFCQGAFARLAVDMEPYVRIHEELIQMAVDAERERCRRIAVEWPILSNPTHPWAEGFAAGCQSAANEIARKIAEES